MKRTFKHIVITRFNVPFDCNCHLDNEWIGRRFDLCDALCFPSLQGQTIRNFSWMPVFHVNTPARWYSRIAKYAKKVNTVPVFLASFDPDSLRRALRDRWRKMPEWIISTRLDSDDALARDHIARVQSLADFTRREFLNFQLGWIWRRGQICIRTYPSNPFLSLIEQSECFQSCYCVPHPRAASAAPIRQIADLPAWLQVVHGGNLSTHVPNGEHKWFPAETLYDSFELRLDRLAAIGEPSVSKNT